tara:strand:+ start:258 stop:761 length:504 start_codon:yes stop_codon:yes gene_type:complete
MLASYISAWKRSFDFKGKSTRKEYWQFIILNSIVTFISYSLFLFSISFTNGLNSSFPVAISIPIYIFSSIGLLLFFGSIWVALPLTVRRIRDIGMSWKWIFLVSVPYIGGVFVVIFLTRSSIISIDGNEYYLRYPTKKNHIVGYWIVSLLIVTLILVSFAIFLIAAI